MTTAHDFSATTIDGAERSLADYRGKPMLVVNTATHCGLTPQFAGLEKLHQTFADEGLAVLGFPCDQFGNQNPESDDETAAFCEKNFGVTFPLFSQIEVNGEGAHPLYRWLTTTADGGTEDIGWNFAKFLIDAQGQVVRRYDPRTEPEAIAADIGELLAN